MKQILRIGLFLILLLAMTACVREQPRIIIITATFPSAESAVATAVPDTIAVTIPTTNPVQMNPVVLSPAPVQPISYPTPNAAVNAADLPSEHIVQSGETLSLIAQRYNIGLDVLLNINSLANPDFLQVGQTIILPDTIGGYTANFKILPDSRVVRGPDSSTFDVREFIARQPGFIRTQQDTVEISLENGLRAPRILQAADIVDLVSREYSVSAQLLLILLEYKAQWLSQPAPDEQKQQRPLVSATTAPFAEGLYNQLAWAANQINRGYYGWKYQGLTAASLEDGTRMLFSPELNPGTIALQHLFSLDNTLSGWERDISPSGFYSTFVQYFGDPFSNIADQVLPSGMAQPVLALPFESNTEWRFTGGPHGGWGSGSAWASIDFAPSEDRPSGSFCYVSDYWVTAVAAGIIARSGDGVVVLDLDGDGNEATGWTILYLHISISEDLQPGQFVVVGQRIGNPSCAGGVSNATHVHIARRFNGEWLPADCTACTDVPSFTMGGWEVIGIDGQEYQGYMVRSGIEIQAEQGRDTTINLILGE